MMADKCLCSRLDHQSESHQGKKLFQAQLVASSGRMLLFASRNHDAAFWQSLYTDLVLPPENAGFPQLPASEAAYSHTQLLFGPCIVNPHNVPRDLC